MAYPWCRLVFGGICPAYRSNWVTKPSLEITQETWVRGTTAGRARSPLPDAVQCDKRWTMVQLRAEALACHRGGRVVFTDVNFALASGQLLELRGPNGAGKSSLLRLIAGLGDAAEGTIGLEGGSPE